jgi:SAM-dependent methyltransferase
MSTVTPEAVRAYNAGPILDQMRHSKSFSQREREVDDTLRLLNRFRSIDSSSLIFEIGVGMGWFQVLCLRRGIPCEGIELTPIFVDAAHDLAEQFGVHPKIQLGNTQDAEIGERRYDAVIAQSVLEHTPEWQAVIAKAYRALKPGGLFYFVSSNKFSLFCGDFPGVPFYSWLPDRLRYWIRKKVDGPTIMLWGVDSNQFRYPQLRKFFKSVGFSEVFDYVQVKQSGPLNHPSRVRRLILQLTRFAPARHLMLTFWPSTFFLCRK